MNIVKHAGKEYDKVSIKEVINNYKKKVYSNKNSKYSRIRELYPFLSEESRVLDYGCGTGVIAKDIYDLYGCRIDAVEIDDNELEKAKLAFGHIERISFISLSSFDFPEKKYDLIISSAVIEHVHNPGTYLSQINIMLKENGCLLIGLPNIITPRLIFNQLFLNQKRARRISEKILKNYTKESCHINAWDITHFLNLLSSVGFLMIKYIKTGGIPLPWIIKKIPFVGRFMPLYLNIRIPIISNLSYSMYFIFEKVKDVKIRSFD